MNFVESFYPQIIKIIHLIDYLAFKVQSEITSPSSSSNLIHLNNLIIHPSILHSYMSSELKNSLFFNLIYVLISILYLPNFYQTCYETDKILTFWLWILSIFNLIVIVPRIMAILKLESFKNLDDRVNLSRALWLLIRCNVYKFITKMSKLTFFLYLFGIFRIWQLTDKTQNKLLLNQRFVTLCQILLISFVVKVILSFIKFNYVFSQKRLEKEQGLSKNELKNLKTEEFHSCLVDTLNGQDMCPICCDNFAEKDKVRIMSCPGRHAFHLTCIDRWLVTKKTCPNCNFVLTRNNTC